MKKCVSDENSNKDEQEFELMSIKGESISSDDVIVVNIKEAHLPRSKVIKTIEMIVENLTTILGCKVIAHPDWIELSKIKKETNV